LNPWVLMHFAVVRSATRADLASYSALGFEDDTPAIVTPATIPITPTTHSTRTMRRDRNRSHSEDSKRITTYPLRRRV
jgi:hypothetical protein